MLKQKNYNFFLLIFLIIELCNCQNIAANTAITPDNTTSSKATDAIKDTLATILAPDEPQQTISSNLFVPLPSSNLQAIDIACGGDNPLIFGLSADGKLLKLSKDWNSWTDISPTNVLKNFSVGADGTIWCLDDTNNYWYQESGQTTWQQIKTTPNKTAKSIPAQLSVGNKNEIWARDTANNLWRKKNPVTQETTWQKIPEQGVHIACGGDGKVLLVTKNQVIRTFNRFKKIWEDIIRPATFNIGNPKKIFVKDTFNTIFLDYENRAWKLVPGASGKRKNDWIAIQSTNNFNDIAIGYDGTIVAIDGQKNLLVYKPTPSDIAMLAIAQGPELRGTQMARIIAGPNVDFMRVWTHADSYYDQDAQASPPNNFVELLVGSLGTGPVKIALSAEMQDSLIDIEEIKIEKETKKAKQATSEAGKKIQATQQLKEKKETQKKKDQQVKNFNAQDKRQDIGCFFTLTTANDDKANNVINFGDTVTIWSLYAVEGNTKKAGPLGKEWKWWVNDSHYLLKPDQCDLRVSLLNHPHAQDGWQTFKIISPYNQTGPIHSRDTVILQSMAPQAQERNLWVNQFNWANPDTKNLTSFELTVATKDASHWPDDFYGQQDLGGAQYFSIQAINSAADIPDTGISSNTKNPQQTARDIFMFLQGNQFWYDKKLATTSVSKSLVKSELTAGFGVVSQINNNTAYPLKTNRFGTLMQTAKLVNQKYELLEPLILEGFAKEPPITGFGPSKMITLDKMFSKGIAWIDTPLAIPGKAMISFLAQATDRGGIEVIFNTEENTEALWQIIIGGLNNTTSQILFNGKLIAEATDSHIMPGRFVPYWVSINNGLMLVGAGTPGSGIIMSAYIPNAAAVTYVGLSSHDGPVDYAEVQVGTALHAIAEKETYTKVEHDITLTADDKKITFIDVPVRISNEASIAFTAHAKYSVAVVLENKKGDRYKVIIGAEHNRFLQIERNGTVVYQLLTDLLPMARISKDKPTDYWVSIFGGTIMLGQGKIGDNLFMAWQDRDLLENITKIGFQPADHDQKFSNIEIAPAVTIGIANEPITNEQQFNRKPYQGSMTLYRPFRYDFIQTGRWVTMKDMVSGKAFNVLSTPQQQGEYVFLIDINPVGAPTVQIMRQPKEAPAKIALQQQAILKEIEANKAAKIAEASASVVNASSQIALQVAGSLAFSIDPFSMIGAAASAGAGIGLATTAAGIKAAGQIKVADATAEAQKMRLDAQYGFRSQNSYAYIEQPKKDLGTTSSIPTEAQDSTATVAQRLQESKKFVFSNQSHYPVLLKIYIDILRNIIHPSVIADPTVKKTILNDLASIIKYYPGNPEQLMVILDVLVRAYSNLYLTDAKNKDDIAAKDSWYFTISDIGKTFFNASLQDPDFAFTIPSFYGEYLWLPWALKTPNIGWLIFEVRGSNDVFVCFSQEAVNVRNTETELYETVIGGWDNNKNVIRIQSLGRSAAEVDITSKAHRASQLSQGQFKAYWIGINDGMISLGSGDEIGKNIIMQWQDPYPWKTIKFIGIGSWDVPLEFRNIYTAEGLEALNTMQGKTPPIPQQGGALTQEQTDAFASHTATQVAQQKAYATQSTVQTKQAYTDTAQKAYQQAEYEQTGYLAPKPQPGIMGMIQQANIPSAYPSQPIPQQSFPQAQQPIR